MPRVSGIIQGCLVKLATACRRSPVRLTAGCVFICWWRTCLSKATAKTQFYTLAARRRVGQIVARATEADSVRSDGRIRRKGKKSHRIRFFVGPRAMTHHFDEYQGESLCSPRYGHSNEGTGQYMLDFTNARNRRRDMQSSDTGAQSLQKFILCIERRF